MYRQIDKKKRKLKKIAAVILHTNSLPVMSSGDLTRLEGLCTDKPIAKGEREEKKEKNFLRSLINKNPFTVMNPQNGQYFEKSLIGVTIKILIYKISINKTFHHYIWHIITNLSVIVLKTYH